MTIDTYNGVDENGWCMNCNSSDIRPSDWQGGTRIRVQNLFAKTPARLKFLRGDRAELMSIVDVVKRLAMGRLDVGFTLNNKWRFPKGQSVSERIAAVMGDDVVGNMLPVDAKSSSSNMHLYGFVSKPTLRRASSIDQYMFVNHRPVSDKVLVSSLRAAYMDVMHAREFPLCALYLDIDSSAVDVNVSPAKTEVHFLEPSHVRAFMIKSIRDVLAQTLNEMVVSQNVTTSVNNAHTSKMNFNIPHTSSWQVADDKPNWMDRFFNNAIPVSNVKPFEVDLKSENTPDDDFPLGRVIGQIAKKYILAQAGENLVIVDQHAAHERITYEHLRNHTIKTQPLLTPIVVKLRVEDVMAIMQISDELKKSGLHIDEFGDDSVAIFEKPADWDMDWGAILHDIADEVRTNGHSSELSEKLHLKLANYACHHSVRAGQTLDMAQMNALLRDIENTTRGGECNHGRPVYKFIPLTEIDGWFERV
jgi:DNA mismatch repair protein MutL